MIFTKFYTLLDVIRQLFSKHIPEKNYENLPKIVLNNAKGLDFSSKF